MFTLVLKDNIRSKTFIRWGLFHNQSKILAFSILCEVYLVKCNQSNKLHAKLRLYSGVIINTISAGWDWITFCGGKNEKHKAVKLHTKSLVDPFHIVYLAGSCFFASHICICTNFFKHFILGLCHSAPFLKSWSKHLCFFLWIFKQGPFDQKEGWGRRKKKKKKINKMRQIREK